jgi:integrase
MLEHAQFKARRKPGHVITWGGKQVTRIIKAFRANAEEVGLEDVTPHTLRHTFGTWAAGGGADLLQLGRAMGHTRVKTTERYIKTQTEGLRSVLNAARRGKSGASGRPDRRKEAPPDSGAN